MPYFMKFKQNNKEWKWGPIVPDNPSSPFGLEDRSIERKAKLLAKKLERAEDDLTVEVTSL